MSPVASSLRERASHLRNRNVISVKNPGNFISHTEWLLPDRDEEYIQRTWRQKGPFEADSGEVPVELCRLSGVGRKLWSSQGFLCPPGQEAPDSPRREPVAGSQWLCWAGVTPGFTWDPAAGTREEPATSGTGGIVGQGPEFPGAGGDSAGLWVTGNVTAPENWRMALPRGRRTCGCPARPSTCPERAAHTADVFVGRPRGAQAPSAAPTAPQSLLQTF